MRNWALIALLAIGLPAQVVFSAKSECWETGERAQGAPGYPAVEWKPCCDGRARQVEKDGAWGKFCLVDYANIGCWGTGERAQGAPGFPYVEWKPCCDGRAKQVEKDSEWGKFCAVEVASVDGNQTGKLSGNRTYDLSGDGSFDKEDVILLFRSISDPLGVVSPGSGFHDFNDDGRFDLDDIERMVSALISSAGPESVAPLTLNMIAEVRNRNPQTNVLNRESVNRQVDAPPSSPQLTHESLRQEGSTRVCDARRRGSGGGIVKGSGPRPSSTNWDLVDPDEDYNSLAGQETAADYFWYAEWNAVWSVWIGPAFFISDLFQMLTFQRDTPSYQYAVRNWFHYVWASGDEVTVPYQEALDEEADTIGRQVDAYVDTVKSQLAKMHEDGENRFSFHSTKTSQVVEREGTDTGWAAAIGSHVIWAEGDVVYDAGNCELTASITVKMSDLYDFNFSETDHGPLLSSLFRFSQLGWARRFAQYGQSDVRTEVIPLACCDDDKCGSTGTCECHECSNVDDPGNFTASLVTDPHLRTFDGLSFDCQASGEFILARSSSVELMVQGRFSGPSTSGSVFKAIAIREGDSPTLQVSFEAANGSSTCPLQLTVDGDERAFETATFGNDGSLSINVGSGSSPFVQVSSASGCIVGFVPRLSRTFGCYLESFSLSVPPSLAPGITGLLGTPNDDVSDDWQDQNGTVLSAPDTASGRLYEAAYSYCTTNWCIRDPEASIFAYEAGQSHSDFALCDRPYVRPDVESASPELVALCGGSVECLIDGVVGSEEDAQAGLDAMAAIESRFNNTVNETITEVTLPSDLSNLTLHFIFSWEAKGDLDTSATWLGNTVGYACGAGKADFMTWSNDDTSATGSETYNIDLNGSLAANAWNGSTEVQFGAGWYLAWESLGTAKIRVSLQTQDGADVPGTVLETDVNPGTQRGCANEVIVAVARLSESEGGEGVTLEIAGV